MMFKKEMTFYSIQDARRKFCNLYYDYESCVLSEKRCGDYVDCADYCEENKREAAELMGYDIIDDEQHECEYCKADDSGDLVAKDIVTKSVESALCDLTISGYIDNGALRFCIVSGDKTIEMERKIRYCPMCGESCR